MQKIKKTCSIILLCAIFSVQLSAHPFWNSAIAKGVTSRDDGIWLFPLAETYYNYFTDWAGCPGTDSTCPICGKNHNYDGWGDGWHGGQGGHNGFDVGVTDAPVYAARSGNLYYYESVGARGNTVIIEHKINNTYSYYSYYQHLSYLQIKNHSGQSLSYYAGINVEAGYQIAISGNTGGNYGKHLHFGIVIGPSGNASTGNLSSLEGKGWILSTNVGQGGRILNNPSNPPSWNYSSEVLAPLKAHAGSVEYVFDWHLVVHQHSYSEHYEAAHPHKKYMQCSCGDKYYTGANAGELSNHYEDAHPHKEYTSCSLCSYKNYTGKTRTVATCLDCGRPTSSAVGRTIYNGHIYEVYKTNTTWKNAKTYAEEMGGYLVTITSAEEQAAINSISHGSINALWIGATDEKEEGKWKWVTDEPFSYSFWNDSEPNNSGGSENYAHLSYNAGGKWNDLALSDPNAAVGGFIVEYEPQLTDTVQGNGHTYEVYKGQTNWAAAKEFAEKKDGHLVTITSAEEQTTVYQKIVAKFGENLWIGASDEKKEGAWEWVTGESFAYKNWNDSQPDNWEGNEHYAHVYGNTGRWNDVPLSNSSIKGFIVEYDCNHDWKIESTTVEATCTQTGIAVVKCAKCGQTQSVGYRANGELLDSTTYEWTTTPPPPNAVQVEKKTQYRYSKKETTESGSSSLSGWTRRTDVTNPVTEYGSWKNENPTTSKPTESDTLRITKSYVSAYNYYHVCNNYYDGCWNVDSIPYGSGNHYRHTISVSSPLPAINIADKGGKQFYGGSGSGAPACSSNWYIWIYESETYTYEYQTRSATTKYFYYRWKDFSDWQDAAVTADDNTKVETRTVYRYYAPQTVSGDHVWDSGKVTKAATCAATGVKTFICTICKTTKTETIAKTTNHTWDAGKVTKAATCAATGVKTYTCSVCNTTKTESIEKLNTHTWDDGVVTKQPSLLTEGEKTYTCTVCKTKKTEVIPVEITPTTPTISVGSASAAPDSSVSVNVSIANNPGINTFALGFSYDTNRLSLKSVSVDSALGGQFQYAKKAVWLNSSDTKYNGAILKLTFDVAANAKEGDTKVTVTYQPGDISNYNEDDVMFAVSSGTITVGNHTHTWDSGKVTKAATCTADGVKTFTCTVCKETKTEVIKAIGHKAVTDKAVAATCTKDGKTEGSHCSVCGTVLKAQTVVPATGHKWDGGKVTKAATCAATGVKTYTCTICKTTKTETIPKTTDHKWDSGKVTKAATCAATGVKTYTCTVCKTTKTETIAKTNDHSWDEGHFVTPDRKNLTAIESYTCTICKKTKTEKHKYTLGDVDQDNQITAADARLALRRAVGLEDYLINSPQYLSCDVDFDSNVSAADARLILRAAVGLEDPIKWK